MGLSSLLGLDLLDSRLVKIGKSYLIINVTRTLSDSLLYITLVLFLIDNLTPVELGIVWGVHFAVLGVIDYPTGILGDLIGYKRVLVLAYFFKIISVIFLLTSQGFSGILIFLIIYALGLSQESGAMEAWFDNSYKVLKVDSERKSYTAFIARLGIYSNIFAGIGFITGGLITTLISPHFLFLLYFFTLIGILLLIIFYMARIEVSSDSKYFKHMWDTIKLFFSNKAIFYYFIGTAILWTSNESIWHTFLSVRLYREYTGSVAGAGIIRSVLFGSIIFYQVLVVKYIYKFTSTNLWIFISSVMSNSVFFFSVMLYFIYFPPITVSLNLIIGFLLLYQVPMFLESIEGVLRSKVSIDLIPDKFRNSMYSLLPSLARLLGSLFVIVTGGIVSETNLVGSFVWLIVISFVGTLILGVGLYKNSINP